MRKFFVILFFIFTFAILNVANFSHSNLQQVPTIADSGFDSDYGNYDDSYYWDDDYGSGSYWDDDDDYYGGSSRNDRYSSSGSYSGGPVEPEVLILALLISTAPVVIIFLIKGLASRRRYSKRRKSNIKEILNSKYNLIPGDGLNVQLVQSAYNNYVKIQNAWMNRDLSPIKNLLTDEMYNMYQMQVDTLIEDNQINVMSNFNLVCGRLINTTKHDNMETLSFILCVECKDYIKMANKPKVINGSKHSKITYIYELTFVRDVNGEKTTHCPTCGAEVKNQMSANCPYCNNKLLLTSSEITLSNKVIRRQFKD